MDLLKASNQWATRPADERFWTIADLDIACRQFHNAARTKVVPFRSLAARDDAGEVVIVGQASNPATLTNWAFGQLCQRAEAPASYLRTLPAPLAVACVNQGLSRRREDEDAAMLFHTNGGLRCHALTSERYTRIWNEDITLRLLQLADRGWRVPPARPMGDGPTRPATADDVLRAGGNGLSINVGDLIGPAGLYASDHDMFAFLVNEHVTIDAGQGAPLNRGFFCWNSEVGAASFGIMTFLYDHVCGNHIVWGARNVTETRVRHIGAADVRAFGEFAATLTRYADDSVSDTEARIQTARRITLGKDKDAVLDRIFGLRVPVLSRKRIADAYQLAEQFADTHGDPRSAWGMASGLTRLSQSSHYADERVAIDRAAGKVLELAF